MLPQLECMHRPNGLLVHHPRSYDHACQTSRRLPLKAMGHAHARSDRKQDLHILDDTTRRAAPSPRAVHSQLLIPTPTNG